jgi:NIMA (never in mitosis gene a)-related kinase
VEALRVFLEQELGTGAFVAAYRRMEALQPGEDEAAAARDFSALLGGKLGHLQLIHQLIVCEENMHAAC